MPTYEVVSPDGKKITLEAPEGATEDQIVSFAKAAAEGKEAEWSDVLRQAPIKGLTAVVDETLNLPENVMNLGKAMMGSFKDLPLGGTITNALQANYPEMPASELPQVEPSENEVNQYLKDQGVLFDIPNMSPEQKIADQALQAGAASVLNPGRGAVGYLGNIASGAASGAAGEKVLQETGDPLLAIGASMATGVVGSRAPGAQSVVDSERARNALKDQTLEQARKLGYIVVPETRAAEWAGRKKMLQIASDRNQRTTNDIAKRTLGLTEKDQLNDKTFSKLRNEAYTTGYMPLKALGAMDPDTKLLDDFVDIELNFTGRGNTFPGAFPEKLRKEIEAYMQDAYDAEDVVNAVRQLRRQATKAFNSNAATPDDIELAHTRQAIADTLEDFMERQATLGGASPELIENYRAARKQIAVSHLIENATERGSGDVDIEKLGRVYQKGDYLTGELRDAAAFGNIMKPKAEQDPNNNLLFGHALGIGLGTAGVQAMNLPGYLGPALALGGWWLGGRAADALRGPTRSYMLSEMGQNAPNYSAFGVSPLSGTPGALTLETGLENDGN